jgi:aminoglycoside phosphotransferase (APT) family kinase protein
VREPDPRAAGEVLVEAGEPVRPADVTVEPLPGGASRETWLLRAGERLYVLKRDPLDELEPWSSREHEFRAAAAAFAAGVPAARPVAFEPRGGRFGTAALVSDWVEGTSSPRRILSASIDGEALVREIGRAAGRLASVDVRVALQQEPPASPVDAILAGFAADLDLFAPHRPVLALALRWLELNRPPARPAVLAHGDFRVGNVMTDSNGRLAALIDWEFCRVGDVATDLGYFCLHPWRYGRENRRAGGLGGADSLLEGYAETAPEPVDERRLRFGEVAGQLWWGLYCLRHSTAYLAERHRDFERLLLGRRIAEVEWDLLALVEEGG